MSSLREKFARELKIRGPTERTNHAYLTSVRALAKYYQKSPDQIGDEQIREWLLHLIRKRKLAGSSVNCAVQAVRAGGPTQAHWPDRSSHRPSLAFASRASASRRLRVR